MLMARMSFGSDYCELTCSSRGPICPALLVFVLWWFDNVTGCFAEQVTLVSHRSIHIHCFAYPLVVLVNATERGSRSNW